MRKLSPEFERQLRLRQDAESRLLEGSAPPTGGWTVGPDSLTLLYRLASDPDTAADALRLLSELQTYQVELDLQHAQLQSDREEMEQALARYRDLYEFAPVGYLVVGLDGSILEGNRAGADLLGTERDGLEGQPLTAWFSQGSQSAVQGLIDACREGAVGVRCSAEPRGRGNSGAGTLELTATLGPGGEDVLLVISRCELSPR